MEDASNHLENCNNAKEIAAYKKELAKKKSVAEKKIGQEELQADIQVKIRFLVICPVPLVQNLVWKGPIFLD